MGSGKDTVGSIIQVITEFPHFSDEAVENWIGRAVPSPKFEIKKYADKLKDIACILIGCTKEDLESQEFKSTELGEEWWYYNLPGIGIRPRYFYGNINDDICESRYLVKPTPRLILQQLGTDCGRNIIHPKLWENSLLSSYKEGDNWLITDMRFPNELEAIKNRDGITIRVNRNNIKTENHASETALDNSEFDVVIDNNGSLKKLIEVTRSILSVKGII